MKTILKQHGNRAAFLAAALFLSAAVFFVFAPVNFRSQAESKRAPSGKNRDARGLENYDIRADAGDKARKTLEDFRQAARAAGALIFNTDKADFAENVLRKRVPTLKIERSEDLKNVETIAPDVKNGRAFLSAPNSIKRPDALRAFIAGNKDLFGLSEKQIADLEQTKDYTNPDGVLSFTQFEQKIRSVPVFRGEVKAAFTKRGELVRVINNLAPDLDYELVSNDFHSALDAVKSAAADTDYELRAEDLTENDAASTDLKRIFGAGDWATTAEKMYFPTENGVARTAWRVLIWEKSRAFYVIVDAESGATLWRKNITEDQTQAATFSVYTNPNAMINVAKNPFPVNPGISNPSFATQGAALNRTNITRVGSEAPYAFNNRGWIADGGAETDGNAVEAGIDRDDVDGIDASGRAVGGANRNFVFDYAPGNPNTNGGDIPVPVGIQTYPISAYQMGAVTQLFYICNRFHDETYRLGFTEAAGNFQADNFGRGGAGNDRVSAEAQDSSGFNNANFSPPADGSRGKMQMYLWNAPSPDFDGDLDADVVVHEFTHGLSNRLHGNSSGLNTNMARAMGEGWSDFYALSLLSQPSDPLDGVYPMGGYATYLGGGAFTANNYYGIRRFPKAIISAVGANGRPHNPLTFRQVNPPCNSEIGTASAIGTISAYARGYFGSATCDQAHAAGEVWSSALWEVRAKFIARLGWEAGNRKILQIVTDAMKISALNPTFLQARDAIIAAAQASGTSADAADVWSGFAARGMGFSATITATGGGANNASVNESFDVPNVVMQTPGFTINDAGGNNNGYADAGETILLNVPLTNTTGKTAANVTVQVAGGAAVNYGDIADNQTVTRAVSFTVPANQSCASLVNLTFNISGGLGAKTETRDLFVGNPNAPATFTEKFDSAAAPNIPSGWTISAANPSDGSAAAWTTVNTNSSSAPNALFAPDPDGYYQAQIESPAIPISVSAARLKFKINYNTEAGWDGALLEIKIGAGAFQDIESAGGKFVTGAYARYLAGTSAANLFPNATKRAWSGNSNGFVLVEVYLPASAANQTVRFRWTASADVGIGGAGVYLDDVEVVGGACGGASVSKARADFDGDGRTDFSVFRPSDGNWYALRTRDGFSAVNWGLANDKAVGGDFDGDGKADPTVYRPSSGVWYILQSSNSNLRADQFGLSQDKPVAADYDGDGKTDEAVYRPSDGVWYLNRSRDGYAGIQFGIASDAPAPADFDGDGKTDVAVYRDGLWIINKSSGGVQYVSFGLSGDKPVPADYDGDGRADVALWRPSNGVWYIQRSRDGYAGYQFGVETDTPAPGDYDGDGRTDIAVYRGGNWFVVGSANGFFTGNFGVSADVPVPSRYIP